MPMNVPFTQHVHPPPLGERGRPTAPAYCQPWTGSQDESDTHLCTFHRSRCATFSRTGREEASNETDTKVHPTALL